MVTISNIGYYYYYYYNLLFVFLELARQLVHISGVQVTACFHHTPALFPVFWLLSATMLPVIVIIIIIDRLSFFLGFSFLFLSVVSLVFPKKL